MQTTSGLFDSQLKNIARWDPGLYYNIWVVNKIDDKDGTAGSFIAGYATYPSFYPQSDGTVMLATQMRAGGKTLPHEIGHALFLRHPFENAADPASTTCSANVDCNSDGDAVCDTDPNTLSFSVRSGPNPCRPGYNYTINTEHNVMSYTNTYTVFTADQRTRMQAAMSLPSRASLASSWAIAPGYPYAFSNPAAPICQSVTDPMGLSAGYAGILGVSLNNRYFSSSLANIDAGYVNKLNSPLHLIPLSPGGNYSLSTDLYTINPQQVAAWIDFNNDNAFDNSTELIMFANGIPDGPQITRVTSAFTVPPGAVTNTVIKMRVIEDNADGYPYEISDACFDSYYGQAEDFPVFISSVLPVEWKNFKGKRTGTDIVLTWATSTEYKNKEFQVERSVDGNHFYLVGTVKATNQLNGDNYSFIDYNASLPVYFYRLKQIGSDNEWKYSATVNIRQDQQAGIRLVSINNPFTNTIRITIGKAFAGNASVEIIDVKGQRIIQETLRPGQKTITIDVSAKRPAPGLYILRIEGDGETIIKKLVKE
jgi:hypothetical protein